MSTSHLYAAMLQTEPTSSETVRSQWKSYAVIALIAGLATIPLFVTRTDRTEWSELPCVASHVERYQRPDDRPHAQGGRGGTVTASRGVCDEYATVGPVMPRGWKPSSEPAPLARR